MAPRLLRAAEYRHQPWRNGGGTTAEIWREPGGGSDFLWRLSMAEVESDGPFSAFPGIDRHIMLLQGNGMILDHAGLDVHRLDRPFISHAFPGDVATDCRLIDGPCRDLNLMVRRERATGGFAVLELRPGEEFTASDQWMVAAIVLKGELGVSSTGHSIEANAGDTVILVERGSSLDAKAGCVIAMAHVRPAVTG